MELRADRLDAMSFEALKDRVQALAAQVAVAGGPGPLVRVRLPINSVSSP
jgi:hypothetical protein